MKVKACVLIFLGLSALLVAGGQKISSAPPHVQAEASAQPQEWEDPTTIKARAKKERAKGARKAHFPAPVIEYATGIDLDTALSQASVFLVEPVDKTSLVVDPNTIGTFYRLKVIETISSAEPSSCCQPSDSEFPGELPPLNENEMYLAGIGGTVMLDGMEVTVDEALGELIPRHRFLVFLTPTPSRKYSLSKLGPYGIFRVKATGDLEAIVKTPYKLKKEMVETCGCSLEKLKESIKNRK